MTTAGIVPQFQKAKRVACKASIMIEGLTGTGKTGLALAIGIVLADNDWNKIAMIDAENHSSNLFVGIENSNGGTFEEFNVAYLTSQDGFAPSNYLYLREHAIKELKATVCIKDSITHAWMYQGGVLDLVNTAKASNRRFEKDPYAAWSDPKVSKEKNELLNLIRDHRCHVITTVRVKEKFEYVPDDESGKNKLKSLGEQQIQQSELKYEPDLVLHMLEPGKRRGNVVTYPKARVVKSRYVILDKDEEYEFTPVLIAQLRDYLKEGIDPNELLKKQQEDYITGIKTYLDANVNKRNIWKILKEDKGFKGTPLEDIPLKDLKVLFLTLSSD